MVHSVIHHINEPYLYITAIVASLQRYNVIQSIIYASPDAIVIHVTVWYP